MIPGDVILTPDHPDREGLLKGLELGFLHIDGYTADGDPILRLTPDTRAEILKRGQEGTS